MSQVNPNFRVDILFPDEYQEMIAEVYFQDEFVCLITQEDGSESTDIEIGSAQTNKSFKFRLAEFEDALAFAKKRLWELRETP